MKLDYSKNICRLCLENDSLQSIYNKDECGLSIYEKITHCTDIQISADIKWPDKICDSCLQCLDAAFKFRMKCNNSDELLQQFYAENEIESIGDEEPTTQVSPLENHEWSAIVEESEVYVMKEVPEHCVDEFEDKKHENDEAEIFASNYSFKAAKVKKIFISNRKKKSREKSDIKCMHICEVCGNTYQYKSALETHMRRHTDEKPFACEICGRRFVLNGQLTCHMRTHTGEKPYECRHCKRRYADVGARQVHERIHTGERPFKCDICNKSFTYASVLKKHLLTHTDEKKYSCEFCGKKFRLRYHLTAHLKTSKHQGISEIVEEDRTKLGGIPAK